MASSKKVPILLHAAPSYVRKGAWIPISFDAWSLSVEPSLKPNVDFVLTKMESDQAQVVELNSNLSNSLKGGLYKIEFLGLLDNSNPYSFYATSNEAILRGVA